MLLFQFDLDRLHSAGVAMAAIIISWGILGLIYIPKRRMKIIGIILIVIGLSITYFIFKR